MHFRVVCIQYRKGLVSEVKISLQELEASRGERLIFGTLRYICTCIMVIKHLSNNDNKHANRLTILRLAYAHGVIIYQLQAYVPSGICGECNAMTSGRYQTLCVGYKVRVSDPSKLYGVIWLITIYKSK